MQRYKLTLEYDGRDFVGWQRQENGLGVQQVIEEAVSAFSGEETRVFVAGRTDSGVHALGQVAHIDVEKETDGGRVRDALNYHIRHHAVAILKAEPVDAEFHARFSAVQRAYMYKIINRRPPVVIDRGHAWWVPQALDVAAMQAGAAMLPGNHDFSTFRAANCQADGPVKTLDEISVIRDGDEIIIRARARSFLYHQVRNFVGTLKLVGEGKWTPDDVATALAAADRTKGGPTAPPEGLYLTEVVY